MKALMYGAGKIGRGFMGQIFALSGYELTFIDIVDSLVDALNRDRRYPVRILPGNGADDVWIEGIRAINAVNEEDTAEAIAGADIMATAVGVRSLSQIAPMIAAGLKRRFIRGMGPFNIIICENLIDSDKVLEGLIKEHLSREEQKNFDDCVGLVEASVSRTVPLQTMEMLDGNPLRMCVEAYGFLPVNKVAFKGDIPALTGLCPFDNFDFYIQRKLFVHNMGHGICGYFGMIRGDKYIYESVSCTGILFLVQNAMMESAMALSAKYGMPLTNIHYHIRDLLLRFSNKALGDTCARVGADSTRKLGNKDRFIGAFNCCVEQGINPAFISAGIATALYCHLKEKGRPQREEAALAALREVSGIEGANAEKILLFYSLLIPSPQERGFENIIEKIIMLAAVEGQRPGII